jgi:hypothetical protein
MVMVVSPYRGAALGGWGCPPVNGATHKFISILSISTLYISSRGIFVHCTKTGDKAYFKVNALA